MTRTVSTAGSPVAATVAAACSTTTRNRPSVVSAGTRGNDRDVSSVAGCAVRWVYSNPGGRSRASAAVRSSRDRFPQRCSAPGFRAAGRHPRRETHDRTRRMSFRLRSAHRRRRRHTSPWPPGLLEAREHSTCCSQECLPTIFPHDRPFRHQCADRLGDLLSRCLGGRKPHPDTGIRLHRGPPLAKRSPEQPNRSIDKLRTRLRV